jgi:hypothetical protein
VTASAVWADVREAMRLDGSFARLMRKRAMAESLAKRKYVWIALWRGVPLALKWGGPPVVVLTATADDPAFATFMVVVLGGVWHTTGDRATKIKPFEALRLPSLVAIVLGRVIHQLPWLLWCGTCLAMTVWLRLSFAGRIDDPWSWLLLVAAVLGPVFAMVRAASFAAFRRTQVGRATTPIGCVAMLLSWFAVRLAAEKLFIAGHEMFYLTWWTYWTGWSSSQGLLRRGRFADAFPLALLDLMALLPAGFLIGAGPAALAGIPDEAFRVYAVVAFTWVTIGGAYLTIDAIRCATICDVVEIETSVVSSGVRSAPALTVERRRRPGRGPWIAAWEWWRRHETVGLPRRGETREEKIGGWIAVFLAPLVLVFRGLVGPALAAGAVFAAAKPTELTLAFAAAAAGAFASRTYVGGKLEERMYLLGVDYALQARQEVRSLLLVAAPPTLLAATIAACVRGLPPDALLAIAAVAAFLLVRAGWPGLVSNSSRILGCFPIVAGVLLLIVLPSSPWVVGALLAGVGALGAAGLARRLARLDEARLRDEMRAAAK